MSKRALIFGAAAFLIAAPFGVDLNRLSVHPITAEAAASVSVDVFFNNLQPYGSWVQAADHPYVFVPANVGPNWVPYSNGHWIYTDRFGWYFESDEPFASITYHYGRWAYSDDIGWYWVPGTRWAPAWVVWRRGGGHVGWAPLPPEGTGYAIDVNVTVTDVPDRYWVFVPVEQFLAPQLNVVVEFGDRGRDVFAQTQFAGPVVVQNNVIVNNVIDVNFIQQQTKQKVVVHQVQEVSDPKQAGRATGGATAVKAFVANVEPPKPNIKPAQVADIKAAKAKQAQGGGAANAGGAAANAGGGATGAVAGGAENCKADASGKMPANCTPAGNAKTAAAAEINQPGGGAKTGAVDGATAGAAGGGNAGAAASADNCKPDAAGKLPADCTPAAKTKTGAAANAEINQPGRATGQKANPKEKAAGAAATDTGKVTDNGKPKTGAEGQAAGEAGMGNKGCTPQQIKAGAPGCGATGGAANAGGANGAAGVPQEKTGSLTKGGAQPEVQTGKTGQPADSKCTPELKKEKKC